jgi:hypothetical protein
MSSLLEDAVDLASDGIIALSGGKEKLRGKYGERKTRSELRFLKLFGRDGKILKNIYVPKSEGGTTEIDNLFITRKGIFVLETKNYSGWIFGNEKDYQWTQSFSNGKKQRFYNPILQNRSHIKHLTAYLEKKIPYYSIIVFLDNGCKLKKITVTSPDVYVVTSDALYATIRDIWKKIEESG